MVGLSGYHQVLFEDTAQNRLHEALELFEEITGRPGFKETPIFLFLNKKGVPLMLLLMLHYYPPK